MESNEISWPASDAAEKNPLSWLGMKPLGMSKNSQTVPTSMSDGNQQGHEVEAQHNQQRALVAVRQTVESRLRARR